MPIAQKNLEFDGPGRDGAVKSPARPVGWAGPDQHGLRDGPGQARPSLFRPAEGRPRSHGMAFFPARANPCSLIGGSTRPIHPLVTHLALAHRI